MTTNWNLYNSRLNVNGVSTIDRYINSLQDNITSNLPHNPSCKSVKINGVDRSLNFTKTSTGYDVSSLPNESFTTGDYVEYKSKTYLVINVDGDDDAYTTGKIQLCNYILKFQSPTGTILSYPCITSNTKFGTEEGRVISLPDNQKSIWLPWDENTSLLSAGNRMYVDRRNKTPYKILSEPDNTSYGYSEKGLISFVVVQDLTSNANDRPDLGICDYREVGATTPVDPTVPTIIVQINSSTVNFNNSVKLGMIYNFSATFKNEAGNSVIPTQPKFTVDDTYGGLVVLTDNGDATCSLKAGTISNTDLCAKQFTLTCMDMASGFSSSILLTIVGLF